MINRFAWLIALILSASSGAISVFGLATIFSGAYQATIAIASVLEITKVTVAAWLQVHWKDINKTLRIWFSLALLILMMITSIGVYGFFARAHIDQQIQITTGDASKIPLVQNRILTLEEKIKDIDSQIGATDQTLATITAKAKTSKEATASLAQAKKEKASRDKLRKEREAIELELIEKRTEKVNLENKIKKIEAEVGPLKYIADFFYGKATPDQLEHSVRWLIIVIMSVFDPLAVMLIVATTMVSNRKKPFKFVVNNEKQRTQPVR